MPSPFPGMDPYLEDREIFPDFHDSFITYLREAIQQQPVAPYLSTITRRTWIESSERYVEPDVNVLRIEAGERLSSAGGATTAVMQPVSAKPLVVEVEDDEFHEKYLNIYQGRRENRRLVTTIEILSHSNKTPGQRSRELYQQKQRETLSAAVNLVEFDLLRGGYHSTAVPLRKLRETIPVYDYHISIRRFDRPTNYFVYAILLDQPLPAIEIPLLPEDGAASVDLQVVMNRCYDAAPYRVEIRYGEDPLEPPLTAEQRERVRAVTATFAAREEPAGDAAHGERAIDSRRPEGENLE